jgi:hypothetical protein
MIGTRWWGIFDFQRSRTSEGAVPLIMRVFSNLTLNLVATEHRR